MKKIYEIPDVEWLAFSPNAKLMDNTASGMEQNQTETGSTDLDDPSIWG